MGLAVRCWRWPGLSGLHRRQVVFVEEQDVTGCHAETRPARDACRAPQVENVFPDLTVRGNLGIGGYVLKSECSGKDRATVPHFPDLKVAAGVGVAADGDRERYFTLAWLMVPIRRFLILDEPSGGLALKVPGRLIWGPGSRRLGDQRHGVLIVEQNTRETRHDGLCSGPGSEDGAGRAGHDLLEMTGS